MLRPLWNLTWAGFRIQIGNWERGMRGRVGGGQERWWPSATSQPQNGPLSPWCSGQFRKEDTTKRSISLSLKCFCVSSSPSVRVSLSVSLSHLCPSLFFFISLHEPLEVHNIFLISPRQRQENSFNVWRGGVRLCVYALACRHACIFARRCVYASLLRSRVSSRNHGLEQVMASASSCMAVCVFCAI